MSEVVAQLKLLAAYDIVFVTLGSATANFVTDLVDASEIFFTTLPL